MPSYFAYRTITLEPPGHVSLPVLSRLCRPLFAQGSGLYRILDNPLKIFNGENLSADFQVTEEP